MNKLIIALSFIIVISGCDGKYKKAHTLVDDGKYAAGMQLPKEATNKKYIGNGWFKFELNGECFMYADKGRSSVLTIVSCKQKSRP